MASSAEHEGESRHHDDLERRLSGDRLLEDDDPLASNIAISKDILEPVMRHGRWLLYLAAASSLLWCVQFPTAEGNLG
ncbi:hypothetical protein F4804DRAFT_301148 [Jackrogersella minutella]|nr:hypothetical protein F4804DRAFT_301148 [Jackrogersella minutella]